jgi:hypothetical protein
MVAVALAAKAHLPLDTIDIHQCELRLCCDWSPCAAGWRQQHISEQHKGKLTQY